MLSKTIIADVKQFNVNVRRDYIFEENEFFGQHEHREHNHRIMGVTNDDRVAELIEEVNRHSIGSAHVPFDCVIAPLMNGSPDYIEWVKLQTMKKDEKLAHYNIRPEDEIHGLDNAIGSIGSVSDAAHSTSAILANPSAHGFVQTGEKSAFAEGDDDEDSTAE